MKPEQRVYLFTRDEAVARRLQAYAPASLPWRCHEDPGAVETALHAGPPCLLCVDLRVPDALDHIARWRQETSDHVIIALGEERSDLRREAERLGVYATIPLDPDRLHFSMILDHALDRLSLQLEIHRLRQQAVAGAGPVPGAPPTPASGPLSGAPLHPFANALRRFDDPTALVKSLVEWIAESARVTRAGVFVRTHETQAYTLQAHLHGLESAQTLSYAPHHPLVRWLETRAHLISRATLPHIPDAEDQWLLRNALTDYGAEIICPLFACGCLSGWVFLGQRATGIPFRNNELEDINTLAEHVAATLEKAHLYEEVNLQKTLAEVLFHSIPLGVVAVDNRGMVRWCNAAAQKMMGLQSGPLHEPVAELGSRLADHLNRACDGNPPPPDSPWIHPKTGRQIRVQTHAMVDPHGYRLGAVALLHDSTDEQRLQEKQEQVERAAFWAELAASMSHEIRNPLVAIKAFAQLLPERYDDKSFRTDFSRTVNAEVSRLENLIDQINAFAHPPVPREEDIDLRKLVADALREAKAQIETNGVDIRSDTAPRCPPLRGDAAALQTCVSHLIRNALEACQNEKGGRVRVRVEPGEPASPGANGNSERHICIRIEDNAGGIPDDIRSNIFSPFCTTKARGMGLGLAIARRVAIDHNGQISLDSSPQGTSVSLRLPAAENTAATASA